MPKPRFLCTSPQNCLNYWLSFSKIFHGSLVWLLHIPRPSAGTTKQVYSCFCADPNRNNQLCFLITHINSSAKLMHRSSPILFIFPPTSWHWWHFCRVTFVLVCLPWSTGVRRRQEQRKGQNHTAMGREQPWRAPFHGACCSPAQMP